MLALLAHRLVAHKRQNVFVKNFAFLVSQLFKAGKSGVVFALRLQLHAQLDQALLEGVAARQFAQDDFVGAPAHIFGAHDFVGVTRFKHAVLMDAAGVCKSIRAHNRLVWLHHKTRDLADHAARGQNLRGIDIQVQVEIIAARFHRHHRLFQAAIACALAQTIDRAFDLARAAKLHTSERVGDRHA